MEIRGAKRVDIRTLSWAIFKATGINLGGWNNLTRTPQTGSLSWRESDGVVVACPDATPLSAVAQIEALLADHDAKAPLPTDFPPEPEIKPPPDPAIAIAAAADRVVRAFAVGSVLTDIEKRNTLVALVATARRE